VPVCFSSYNNNIYEDRKTCIFCVLSLVKPTKMSWNFLKIGSWNFTSCSWEPCYGNYWQHLAFASVTLTAERSLHTVEWKLCRRWWQHVPVWLLARIPPLVSFCCHLSVKSKSIVNNLWKRLVAEPLCTLSIMTSCCAYWCLFVKYTKVRVRFRVRDKVRVRVSVVDSIIRGWMDGIRVLGKGSFSVC